MGLEGVLQVAYIDSTYTTIKHYEVCTGYDENGYAINHKFKTQKEAEEFIKTKWD